MSEDKEKEKKPYSNDDFMTIAMDAWCAEYKPAESCDDPDLKTMYEILEAFDSIYGCNGVFDGQSVLEELKKRGYQMRYDPASNHFKIMVKN